MQNNHKEFQIKIKKLESSLPSYRH